MLAGTTNIRSPWQSKHAISYTIVNIMPSKSPPVFPNEERQLNAFGERIRLARRRRRITTEALAQRAGVSRTTVYHVERGDASVTLGVYLRVLSALGLDKDIDALAADDRVGRQLQDLQTDPRARAKRVR